MDALGVVHKVANKTNSNVGEVVLAWYMKNPDVSIVIPGARKPEQVDLNAKSLEIDLRNSDYHAIDEAFAEF